MELLSILKYCETIFDTDDPNNMCGTLSRRVASDQGLDETVLLSWQLNIMEFNLELKYVNISKPTKRQYSIFKINWGLKTFKNPFHRTSVIFGVEFMFLEVQSNWLK